MYLKMYISVALFFSLLSAQDPFETIYTNYQQHNYEIIKNDLSMIDQKYQSGLEYQFFSAVFNENGEDAKETFQLVFEKGDHRLKILAAKKLMDYYYSKGYYLNASKYQEYLIDDGNGGNISLEQEKNQQLDQNIDVSIEQTVEKGKYFIQVGAFSLEENAKQLVKMLATQNIIARIVERKVDKKYLFCVWLEGKEDFKQTYDYANVIKEKYDLKFRIIK